MVRFAPSVILGADLPSRRYAAPIRSGSACVRERLDDDGYPPTGAPVAPASPVADPFDDADALEALGDEIATLAAHIHAADQRLLALIADFDRRRGWELGGHRSCAHWVAVRTGIDLGGSRERVRAARALAELPLTSQAMARGELSFSKVRALTRVATPGNEVDLLELARGCTTADLERVVRAWKRGSRRDETERERELHESRGLSVFPDEEGMYVVRGRLPAEVGAVLMRAIEAASDALYRERATPGPSADQEESLKAAARRRADALGLLAERGLAAGFGGRDDARDGCPPRSGVAPVSGSRAERYQVVLHVDATSLEREGEAGRSELDDGTRVSAETSRRIACDVGAVRVTHAGAGCARGAGAGSRAVLDVGRRTRTIPPALRRALEIRDRGCRFPGCGLRFCDGHHVRHWADGGETSLGNCVLLCRHHHRLVHEGGWSVAWSGEGRPVFLDPRGGTHFEGRWRPPVLAGPPVGDPGGRPHPVGGAPPHADPGGPPGPWTAGARWAKSSAIPDGTLFRAIEALAEPMEGGVPGRT